MVVYIYWPYTLFRCPVVAYTLVQLHIVCILLDILQALMVGAAKQYHRFMGIFLNK